jgi:DNA-binding GntR family transcriptional regulator
MKINQETLREQIYKKLRHRIISGQISPGEVISTATLARSFGVSLIPLREALWQLESQNVIVCEANKSMRVNQLTCKEMEDALRIRLLLESLAAENSCERRSDSAIREAKRALQAMRASTQRPKTYLMKNTQFHFAIYSCADSPLLLEIIDSLWARIGPYVFIHAAKAKDLPQTIKYHEDMFEAFANKDKDKLIKALRQDLESAAAFIIPFLS